MEKINIVKKWLQNSHHVCVELPEEVYDFISEKEAGLNFDDVNDIAFIIHRFSEMPWTTQEEMLKELDTAKEDLERLNSNLSLTSQKLSAKYSALSLTESLLSPVTITTA